jgi:zinc D-Ala-D-Ala carboxypeptidase
MDKISEHITFYEATYSPTAIRKGITNIPTPEVLERMKVVAVACFEPLRKWYGKAIKINSFFRSTLLNTEVGGSLTSGHVKGDSIDMDAGSKEENKKIFEWCKANLKFDQLINEFDYSWIHISFRLGDNRNESLKALKNANGKTYYEHC